jgi:hypothetical protein
MPHITISKRTQYQTASQRHYSVQAGNTCRERCAMPMLNQIRNDVDRHGNGREGAGSEGPGKPPELGLAERYSDRRARLWNIGVIGDEQIRGLAIRK